MSVLIIMLMEMARNRACAKKTYIQHHKNNTAMDTRREKELRSTQEHLENDRGKRMKEHKFTSHKLSKITLPLTLFLVPKKVTRLIK